MTTSSTSSSSSSKSSSSRSSSTTQATTTTTSPPNPPSGTFPALPVGAALASDQCVSCLLSLGYLGVQGLAASCGVTNPVFFAADLSVIFCDTSLQGRYSSLCSALCSNPCSTEGIEIWKAVAGAGFMATASLPQCNQLCPGYAGNGRCPGTPPCNECGKGSGTCVPC
jgi:hypothetical protein